MITDVNLDMDRICRVCLKASSDLFLLFDESYVFNGVSLPQIFAECTIYKVQRNDELPQQICLSCMRAAKVAYSFKKRSEQSYRRLVGLLENVNQEQLLSGEKLEQSTQTDKLSIYPCEMCDAKFFEPEDLRNHRLNSHKGTNFQCKVCGQTFGRLYRLRSHLALHHPEEGLTHDTKCTVCGKQFSRKDHMRRHLKNVHGKKIPNEQRSEFSTFEESLMDPNHELVPIQLTQSIFNNDCFPKSEAVWNNCSTRGSESDEDFNATNPISSDSFEDHDQINEKPLNLFTAEEPQLKGTFIKVEPMDDYQCEEMPILNECITLKLEKDETDMASIYERTLIEEPETPVMEAIESPSIPTIVGEYLGEKQSGGRHSYVGHKDNKCPECLRVFSRRCHLRRHMLTHSMEKPHECAFCSKRFTRRDHLKNHVRSQHCEKKYKCDRCESAYPCNDALERHKVSRHKIGQNANKVHKCDFCEKSFVSIYYFRKHQLIHTDRFFSYKMQ